MNNTNQIESDYARQVSLEHRKKFAQFFTPYSIAELMTKWLLGNEDLKTVLEPAFGLGIFSRALLSKKNDVQIKGFEIDDLILDLAKKEFSGMDKVELSLQDYMYNDWQSKYDGIICNPPYFKFLDYDNKTAINEIECNLNCRLTGFTNLYTLFLLKSIYQLNQGGRCAYIVPSEFMNSDYGKLVKAHLLATGTLRHIIVIDFEENVFDDALTTASLILCANDDKTDKVQFTNIRNLDELPIVDRLISRYPEVIENSKSHSLSELDPEVKWKTYYQPQNSNKFHHLIPFSTYAKVVRGIATGANDYFTFNLSKAKEFNIDERFLLPCICRSADINGHLFTRSDFNELRDRDKKVFLINALHSNDEYVAKYIGIGEQEEIDKKQLTANRNPWYSLEKRPPPPIWVSVFNRTGLRFVKNEAGITNLTTFHCVYPKQDIFPDISINLLFAYLLTDTARLIFEDNSREYGDGLQKFEPNDLNKGFMLNLGKLSEKKKRNIEEIYRKNIGSGDREFIYRIDKLLIDHFC